MAERTLPAQAEVVARTQESATIFTLCLRLADPDRQAQYRFAPGQFNMLSLYGVGEVPMSIVSDPEDTRQFAHTVRVVGRVTRGLAQLAPGDRVGVRGPFGRGWPLAQAEGRDVLIVTGGLGCAPTVSVINYVMRRRDRFGRLVIIQGVKHANDLIWREQYERWGRVADTQVLIAADVGVQLWPWHVGRITELFSLARIEPARTVAMMCGPEGMMEVAVEHLCARGVPEDGLWLSLERSMHCAVGRCGHCQIGARFVCRDGPVFCYPEVKALLREEGF